MNQNGNWKLRELPLTIDVETKAVLKSLPSANAALAELKGIASTIPNQIILINTLGLQEAKDSSAIEKTSRETINLLIQIRDLMLEYKNKLRDNYKFYSQDLLNNLFKHPYTKIEFVVNDLNVSRITAANYLNKLAEDGILRKERIGTGNYYIDEKLFKLLTKR